ncbi:hypothetical protein E1161_17405 [Saccharopolyspora aridisoli]|uniref:Uncharacterized protein n=1 Tax=Saccharopolyspora aridisoli TaxID=2530385 RepID=A0A4R4UGL4_9PSEU|nr:hypothetical protein [Saccharopolyspora aridisoli]TDC90968.1 hypothetical protein E1161_17405 [Saccharopolyspora aridisoli]
MTDDLNGATRELLEQLADRLPKRRLDSYRTLADSGESAALLNELCKVLIARSTAVTPFEKAMLARLLDMAPAEGHEYIANRDQTLPRFRWPSRRKPVLKRISASSVPMRRLFLRFCPAGFHPTGRRSTGRSHVDEWPMLINELSASLVKRQIPVTVENGTRPRRC